MSQITLFICIVHDGCVYAHLQGRVEFVEEFRITGILSQLIGLGNESRRAVCSVVEDAFQICPVGDASVGFRFWICVLKLGEILQYLFRYVELACHEASSWHGYEHVSAPIFIEPRQTCVYSVALLACDELICSYENPFQCFVKLRKIGLYRIEFSYQVVDTSFSFSNELFAVPSECIGKFTAFFICPVCEDESL